MHTSIKYLAASALCAVLVSGTVQAQTTSKNYVQTLSPKEGMNASGVQDYKNTPSKMHNTIQYFDGLGRPAQTVNRAVTPAGKDLVTHFWIDFAGRKGRDYLPYEDTSAEVLGAFKNGAETRQDDFYGLLKNDGAAYTNTRFERSPLNRPMQTASPGLDWEIGSGHEKDYAYRGNTAEENVRWWQISSGQPASFAPYGVNTLIVLSTKDEQENEVLEYKDLQGRVVLKKVQAPGAQSAAHTGWACTYYVYDDWGSLRFVIPPKAVELMDMAKDWKKAIQDKNFVNEFLFAYKYDARRRMVEKKVPGADWIYMVYDERDRLVLTQDGNHKEVKVEDVGGSSISVNKYQQKSYKISSTGSVSLLPGFEFSAGMEGEFFVSQTGSSIPGTWHFTKYDALDRPVLTGEVALYGNRTEVQAALDAHGTKNEAYVGSVSGSLLGYSNIAYPSTAISMSNILSVNYYDTCENPEAADNKFEYYLTLGYTADSDYPYVKGQLTGTGVKALGGGNYDWLYTIYYYDDKLRNILSVSDNLLDGKDIVATKYHFDGRIDKVERKHSNADSPTDPNYKQTTLLETYVYDNAGRVKEVKHSIDGATPVSLVNNTYNPIGELTQKKLNGTAQTIDYKYNIRGWLTHMNNGTDLSGNDGFGMELKYNTVSSEIDNEGIFNGNISAMIWRNGGEVIEGRAYLYDYDRMDRLTAATYKEKEGTTWTSANTYNVDIGYDLNGNIETLNRWGIGEAGAGLIDFLKYTYANGNNSNRLESVLDAEDKQSGFIDGNTQGNDYSYDRNGSLILDKNKGIT